MRWLHNKKGPRRKRLNNRRKCGRAANDEHLFNKNAEVGPNRSSTTIQSQVPQVLQFPTFSKKMVHVDEGANPPPYPISPAHSAQSATPPWSTASPRSCSTKQLLAHWRDENGLRSRIATSGQLATRRSQILFSRPGLKYAASASTDKGNLISSTRTRFVGTAIQHNFSEEDALVYVPLLYSGKAETVCHSYVIAMKKTNEEISATSILAHIDQSTLHRIQDAKLLCISPSLDNRKKNHFAL